MVNQRQAKSSMTCGTSSKLEPFFFKKKNLGPFHANKTSLPIMWTLQLIRLVSP